MPSMTTSGEKSMPPAYDERQRAADAVEHRLGHRVEEAHDRIARVGVHPREQRRDEHDPEVEREQPVEDVGDRAA